MGDNKNINENELDEMLKKFYLEEKGADIDADEAEFVMGQDYGVKMDPAREKELIEKLTRQTGGFGKWKIWLSSIIGLAFLAALLIYFMPKVTQSKITAGKKDLDKQVNSGVDNTTEKTSENSVENPRDNAGAVVVLRDTFGKWKAGPSTDPPDTLQQLSKTDNIPAPVNEVYVPFITEKDKLRYTKIKHLMLNRLLKKDKALYSSIAADKMEYSKSILITDPFTLRNINITNLEYKTFLADLLIKGRNEDYLKANVISALWKNYGCNDLANSYFQEDKYNDFPVVNVSTEGVRLFCMWMEEESHNFIRENKIKSKPLKIRLPHDVEWLYAVKNGYVKIAFSEGYNTIYDESEGLVDKGFTKRIELIKKRTKRSDSLYDFLSANRYSWSENQLCERLNQALKYYQPNPADTLYSDRMKVFGKTTPVSGMVYEKKSGQLWLSGLSWKNKEDYLKMLNEFKAAGASPFVGFRYVVIDPEDSGYKNPFW